VRVCVYMLICGDHAPKYVPFHYVKGKMVYLKCNKKSGALDTRLAPPLGFFYVLHWYMYRPIGLLCCAVIIIEDC